MDRDLGTKLWQLVLSQCITPEQHALERAVLVAHIEVVVTGRRATKIADLTFQPEIGVQWVGLEQFTKEEDKRTDRQDVRRHAVVAIPKLSRMSGVPYSTACPLSTNNVSTIPDRSAAISFMIFMASMMPTGCPACTESPTATNGGVPGL